MLTSALALLLAVAPTAAPAQPSLEQHVPIVIVGDTGPTGFVLADHPLSGEPIYRPGSGVTAGTGSASDPFVIEGWDVPAVWLHATTAHVVIRGNRIGGVPEPPFLSSSSLHLEEAENVTVSGNDIVASEAGVRLSQASSSAVLDNRITGGGRAVSVLGGSDLRIGGNRIVNSSYGVVVDETVGVEVSGNVFLDDGFRGGAVTLNRARDVLVADNRVERYFVGVYAVEVVDLVVRGNEIGSYSRGINTWFTDGALIEGNRIAGPPNAGILLAEPDDDVIRGNVIEGPIILGIDLRGPGSGSLIEGNIVTGATAAISIGDTGTHEIRRNTLTGNDAGMRLGPSAALRAVRNVVAGNRVGVDVYPGAAGLTLSRNTIADNGIGVTTAADRVDARDNWWGCREGPGMPGCDAAAGDVLTDPWLEDPDPDAGAPQR
jgi:nitrous oxidase accessory protein NosD